MRLTGIGFARRELESGNVAIVPGDPGASALVRRINARDPEEIMPPPGEAEPLTVSGEEIVREVDYAGCGLAEALGLRHLEAAGHPRSGEGRLGEGSD